MVSILMKQHPPGGDQEVARGLRTGQACVQDREITEEAGKSRLSIRALEGPGSRKPLDPWPAKEMWRQHWILALGPGAAWQTAQSFRVQVGTPDPQFQAAEGPGATLRAAASVRSPTVGPEMAKS